MQNENKCNGCPINKKADYLKNLVCKRNCPRENYHDPLDFKLIKAQAINIELRKEQLEKVLEQASELEKRSDDLARQTFEGLLKTVMIAELFKNKFGVDVDLTDALQWIKKNNGNPLCNTCHFKDNCPFNYSPTEMQAGRCRMYANFYQTRPASLTAFKLDDREFKIEPFKHFAELNNSQSKLQ